MVAARQFPVHCEYCCKIFLACTLEERAHGDAARAVKPEVEGCGAPEGEATKRIIDMWRTEAQIDEEDVDVGEGTEVVRGYRRHRGALCEEVLKVAEVAVDEVDAVLPRGEVSCGLYDVFLVSVDPNELPGRFDMLKEGTGVTAEPDGRIEDGIS